MHYWVRNLQLLFVADMKSSDKTPGSSGRKEQAIDKVGMLGACVSGKTIYVLYLCIRSMYRNEETRNEKRWKTRVNCRLFITDDVSFAQ